jgi:hypothetical protein
MLDEKERERGGINRERGAERDIDSEKEGREKELRVINSEKRGGTERGRNR